MLLKNLVLVSLSVFPISEIALTICRRSKTGWSAYTDQGTLKTIWKAVMTGIVLATAARVIIPLPLPLFITPVLDHIIIFFVMTGMAIRWVAISTLGKHFTVNLTVLDKHTLVTNGLYKHIRHPSYSGLLLSFVGCGLSTNNLASVILLMTPICWAIGKRIKIEEAMLATAFSEYAEYQKRTWKILPLW
jgi:protein-S-isoprenylcysteine O-methyltransferase